MRLEVADQHFLICAHVLPFHTMPLKVIQFATDMPKRLGQGKLPPSIPLSSASVAQTISSWSFTCVLIPTTVWGRKNIPLAPLLGPMTPDQSVSIRWTTALWSKSCPRD